MRHNGFTLIEIITVTAIISLIGVMAGSFAWWGMRLWHVTRDQVAAQDSARAAVQDMVKEIREMQISDSGSPAIESVADNKIVFYANTDADFKREQVTYELDGGTIYRCEVESDDQEPPQYPACQAGDRQFVAENIINTGPLFQYYDDTYNGEEGIGLLTAPIDKSLIRLVQVSVLVDYDPGQTPAPLELQTNVSLRNLKVRE